MVTSKLVRVGLIVILLQFFSNEIYCQTKSEPENKEITKLSIANTTWSGVDSDGDFYEFTFLKGGQVSYKTNTSRSDTVQFKDAEDVWFQNGSALVILLGNTSVYKGIIKNNKIEGVAWNANDRRWTWTVTKK